MALTYDQKVSIGYQYVLDLLQPSSPYGAERVKKLRPYGPEEREALELEYRNLDRLVSVWERCKDQCGAVMRVMMQVKDVRRSLARCAETTLNEVELFEIKSYLLRLSALAPAFAALNEHAGLEGIGFTTAEGALDLLDPDKQRVATFFVSESYSGPLREIRREKKQVEDAIRRCVDGKVPDELASRRTALCAREEDEEGRVRGELSRALRPYLDELAWNAGQIGALDLLMQKAALAHSRGGVRPVLSEGELVLEELVNPQIEAAVRRQGKRFVPVSIRLARGATVLTGANMGGKSVALKSVALNVLLALSGFFPFARRVTLPMLHSLHMIAEDLQSVDQGLSSFGAEILRFEQALAELKAGRSLLIMDEFARGTNPAEGAAIVRAVTEYLGQLDGYALLTTHYDGVAGRAAAHYQVAGLRNMDLGQVARELSREREDKIGLIAQYMDYGLIPAGGEAGCPKDALNICRLLGLDGAILSRIERDIDKITAI